MSRQTTRPLVVCIDDNPKELEVMQNVLGQHYDVVTGTNIGGVQEELATRRARPGLFLLDLYLVSTLSPDDEETFNKYKSQLNHLYDEIHAFLAKSGQDRESGFRLMRQVREHYPKVPVVFYTRKGTFEDAMACMSAGATDVLCKPHPIKMDPTRSSKEQYEAALRGQLDDVLRRLDYYALPRPWLKRRIKEMLLWSIKLLMDLSGRL